VAYLNHSNGSSSFGSSGKPAAAAPAAAAAAVNPAMAGKLQMLHAKFAALQQGIEHLQQLQQQQQPVAAAAAMPIDSSMCEGTLA
jgi:hypothetical protein